MFGRENSEASPRLDIEILLMNCQERKEGWKERGRTDFKFRGLNPARIKELTAIPTRSD